MFSQRGIKMKRVLRSPRLFFLLLPVLIIGLAASFSLNARAASATKTISGTCFVSTLPKDADIKLSGNTTLVVDENWSLKSIRGDYGLIIQGVGTTLKLNNPILDCVINLNKPVFNDGTNLIKLEFVIPVIMVEVINTADVIAVEITVCLISIEISSASEM